MNENEIERIANAIHALRPDWPAASIHSLISDRMAGHTRRDAAVALAWVACESETKTPARVLEAGPWWQAANVEAPARSGWKPPRKEEQCSTHPGQWAVNCGGCVADKRAIDDQLEARNIIAAEDAIAQARAAIAEAKANGCQHGVARCADCGVKS